MNKTSSVFGLLAGWLVLSCCTPLCAPHARAATDGTAGELRAARPAGAGTLENRIKTFSKALNLDTAQQTQLARILMQQREAVRKIWSDKTLLPAERAPATQAANERTGEQIRAILNDEQKKKYNAPKPSTAREPGERRSVEEWLDATRAR